MTAAQAQTNDPFTLAQQFRVALYREYIRAKGCTPQDVWKTWLAMPYDGPEGGRYWRR